MEYVIIYNELTIKQFLRHACSVEFNPFVASRQPLFQTAMLDFLFAYKKIKIV